MKISERRAVTAGEMWREMPGTARFIMRQLLTLTFSFALTQIESFGEYSPFGVAFLTGAPRDCILSAALGACLGYIVTPAPIAPMRYIAAVISASVISRSVKLLARKPNFAENAAPFVSSGCLLITGLAIIIPDKPVFTDILLCLAESMLGGGAAYFFSRTFALSPRKLSLKGFNSQELSCIIVSFSIIMMSFSEFAIGGIIPIRILSVFLILLCAECGRESAGCIMGLALGVAMGVSNDASFLIGAYGLGGLLAGVFSPLGQFGCAAAFAAVNGVATLATENSSAALYALAETAVATVIFVSIPSKYLKRVEKFFHSSETAAVTINPAESAVSAKLELARETMKQVSRSVSTVSESLNRLQCPSLESVYSNVKEQVCEDCVNNKICWENKEYTNCITNAFNSFERLLREGEFPTDENIPQDFAEQCARLPQFISAFQQEFVSFEVHSGAIHRLSELREIVSDQFGETAELLGDLSRRIEETAFYDVAAAEEIGNLCPAYGFEPEKVNCIINSKNRTKIELFGSFLRKRGNRAEWTRAVSKAISRPLNLPTVQNCGENTLVTFTERSNFTVHSAGTQSACNGASLCGDAFEVFKSSDGDEVLLISDGMGTGGRAAVDAALAAGIFPSLIQAGLEENTALKIVNSALLSKSGEESFATLDIVKIDTYTGQTRFFKAGAATSFVRQSGVFKTVEIPSTPPGIFRNVEFQTASLKLSAGDIVLLVSDGALNGGTAWIEKELNALSEDTTAQETADKIAAEARARRNDGHEDDITVVACMIK